MYMLISRLVTHYPYSRAVLTGRVVNTGICVPTPLSGNGVAHISEVASSAVIRPTKM